MVVESLKDEDDINFLRNNLNGFSNEQFVELNYSTSLSFDIKIPIINDEDILEDENLDYNFSDDLMYILCKKNKDGIDYYLHYNSSLLSRLDYYFYQTHYQHIEFSKFKLKIELNNDIRKSCNISTYSCYANGQSFPFKTDFILQERDRLNIELSEVFSSYLSKEESDYPILSIIK